jgi:anti-sigma-K factor RskA
MNVPADEIHDAAGAYALDALDDLERVRFEAHLARCAACRQDVADFRDTARILASAVAAEPPASLRGEVLAAIQGVRQDSPFGSPAAHRARPRPWLTALSAAAAIAIIGLLAVITIDARNERDDAQLLAATLAAPDARTVELAPVGAAAGSGRVVWSESQGRAVVVLDELADPGEGRAYELWFIEDGTPRPAGVFDPGGARVVELLDTIPDDADAIGVTEEPAGGSAAPTGPILLLGETAEA